MVVENSLYLDIFQTSDEGLVGLRHLILLLPHFHQSAFNLLLLFLNATIKQPQHTSAYLTRPTLWERRSEILMP